MKKNIKLKRQYKKEYKANFLKKNILNIKEKIKTKKIIIVFVLSPFLIISILLFSLYNYNTKIESYIEKKEYKEALELIEKLLEDEQNNYSVLKHKGKIYSILAREQVKTSYYYEADTMARESIDIFSKLLSDGNATKSSDIYLLMGFNFFILGKKKYEDALKFITKALELNRQDAKIESYLKDRKLPLKINDKNYFFTLNGLLGYLNFELVRYKKSIDYFREAMLDDNKELIYNIYIGLCYFNLSQFDKATEHFEIVVREASGKEIVEYAYFLLSNISFIKKDYDKSEDYIKKALGLKASSENYYQMGLIYEARKDIRTAFKFWRKSLELDAENDKARQRIIRFEKKVKK